MSQWQKGVCVSLLAFALAGCSEFVWPDQVVTQATRVVPLQAGTSVGQTILSREAGLQGVDIFLTPMTSGDGEIRLHLRADAFASSDIAQSDLPLSSVTTPAFYRFNFPSQSLSRLRSYYIYLELFGSGKIAVGNASPDTYLEGALYRDGQPVEAQMAFRLAYEPGQVLREVTREMFGWVGQLGLVALAFVIPGTALLSFWPGASLLTWPEQVGLGIGISLALYPVLFLWTYLIGLQLGAGYAWLPIGGGVLILAWRSWPRTNSTLLYDTTSPDKGLKPLVQIADQFGNCSRRALSTVKGVFNQWLRSEYLWPDLALISVVGFVFFSRLWPVRSLLVPLWGDSYHHVMIAQLLVDHGGLFNSWQPYADLQTFTYHFGFHTYVAIWHWLTGMNLPQATLWTGQSINGLAVLALYPLAMQVGRNRWAGIIAVLMAGLLSPMPMTYVNWGRYTQLAGQAILPGALALVWATLQRPRPNSRELILASLALSGIAVTHYRVLVFVIPFVVAYSLLEFRSERIRPIMLTNLWLMVGAGALALPWILHILEGKIAANFGKQLVTPFSETSIWIQQYNSAGDLLLYQPMWLWLLLPIGVGWGLWHRQRGVALISLWLFVLVLAANPQWLRLPGEGVLSNYAVLIAFYIPVSLIIGATASWLIPHSRRQRETLAVMLCVFGLSMWGARQRLDDVHIADHALVTSPDLRAALWIQAHTPPTARFLVNSFFAFGGNGIVGSDGGWWLPLLAYRQTMLPPTTYGFELGPRPDYVTWINTLPRVIQAEGIDQPATLALLAERGITHVYLGQRQGLVNSGAAEVLQPDELLASPHFRPIYHQDRVWVFELVP